MLRLAVPLSILSFGATAAAACQGATDESRPLVLCQSLAKRAGRLDSFVADGRALSAAELERCNASAKAPQTSAHAAQ